MSDRSKIEWTDATWNPVRARDPKSGRVGWHCVKISPACTHCYAAEHNAKGRAGFGTKLPYAASSPAEAFLHAKTLAKPLHWRRPRRIFVCSMTDLFGDWVDVAMLDEIYSVMAACPQHTFQVLTKRPDRMHRYHLNLAKRIAQIENNPVAWPLPNLWIGVTAENQECADQRIPWLLKTPAAVRFLSCEPLLGPVDLSYFLPQTPQAECPTEMLPYYNAHCALHWVIVGGESGRGPGIRPMHPDWVRSLRDQCQATGVAFFHKQWGEWLPISQMQDGEPDRYVRYEEPTVQHPEGKSVFSVPTHHFHYDPETGVQGHSMYRVGKKKAGRLLDGIEWNQFPAPVLEAV